MDFMLYVMAIGQLKSYFGFDDATAGMIGTVTLLTSAAGGLLFGVIADRFGRTRALIGTILIFSVCSLGAATAQTTVQLLIWRALLGVGMGGEWASGAVLVSESWPAEHRTKAISIMQSGWAIGYIIAAVLSAVVLDVLELGPEAWRWLFALGVLPAVFALWLRRSVEEPSAWTANVARRTGRRNTIVTLFRRPLLRTTVLAVVLTTAVQFAYWGLFFWLPAFLARPVELGGAGMSLVRSMGWIIPMQLGAYAGYLSFGAIADRLGRRRTFVGFLILAALIVPIYGQMARSPVVLMILGPILGFVGHGYFSMFGSFLAELFPTAVRGTGLGLSYNAGRAMSAIAPFTIGAIAALPAVGIGSALALTSLFFLLGAVLVFTLPDRSREELRP